MKCLVRYARPVAFTRHSRPNCRIRNTTCQMNASERLGLQSSDRIWSRSKSYIAEAGEQAKPIEGFYAGI